MSRLSSALILLENRKKDAASLTSLQLTHRALSDIHVLADFRNLERLDLSSNNLSSLEGLHSCINLKWLCVVQNKLKSLKGVEGLSKLMVLNAGHNQLQSMDGVRSLYLLRALILNDNNITFIGRLDGLQQLNTLVLSRNPINDLGDSLVKLKSITKLSLSNCQVQAIGPSLRFSVNLKEVRLAHNEITTLPAELARNAKIQILDLGGNLISKLRDMEVLFSLTNLKNLNLQGNPIAEKAKLDKKVRKLLPSLQVFNGKPVDKSVKTEISRKDASGDSNDVNHPIEDVAKTEAKASKKLPKENVSGQHKNDEAPSKKFLFDGIGKKSKKQSKKSGKMDHEKSIDNQNQITDLSTVDEALKPVGIDDAEIPFAEVVLSETTRDPPDNSRKKRKHQSAEDAISLSGLVSVPKKKKKTRSSGVNVSTLHILSTTSEVGVGGQSSWDA
ncbi:hypothetical protein H6P81_003541 [Aristolochia fimbriata]|uniref:Leucine-rich repeat family protein n=1 Tax=Aristolochia fimbriata TaxID=158543 RepID=A0AAV7FH34_ARIFI|nr:hypothetical protein H6P81_003541 [Aristolochia fimbriata]